MRSVISGLQVKRFILTWNYIFEVRKFGFIARSVVIFLQTGVKNKIQLELGFICIFVKIHHTTNFKMTNKLLKKFCLIIHFLYDGLDGIDNGLTYCSFVVYSLVFAVYCHCRLITFSRFLFFCRK